MNQGQRSALGLAVVALHGALAWSLLTLLPGPRPLSAGQRAPLITWLGQAMPSLAAQRKSATAGAAQPSPAAAQRLAPVAGPARMPARMPARIQAFEAMAGAGPAVGLAAEAEPGPAGAGQPAATAAAPAAAASQAAPPLNLTLPRQRPTDTPPAAWARQAAGQAAAADRDVRLARALGTDTGLHETVRGESRRFQQGRACVDLAPAREAQLNPFNQSNSATPRLAKPC